MKAYIQANPKNNYYNVNAYTAAEGFEVLGWKVIKYQDSRAVEEMDPQAIFVGGVGNIRNRLSALGVPYTGELEYPAELQPFLKRRVWRSTLKEVIRQEQYGIFIKPERTKLFTGKVIKRFGDFIGLKYDEDVPIWCSEVVELVTEWRCFVRYGELLDARRYHGRLDSRLDTVTVEDAIAAYTTQPAAYSLDFGVDAQGAQYLIEVNDGHSLGSYGMLPVPYAKFLSARWAEMTKTEDLLNF